MGSVADDLGPEATPEPDAWPPAPCCRRDPGAGPGAGTGPRAEHTGADALDGNGAAAATATSVGYDRPTRWSAERRAPRCRRVRPHRAPSADTARRSPRSTCGRCSRCRCASTSARWPSPWSRWSVLWTIADAAGVVHSVEKFFGDLLQTKDFTFLDEEILRGALLVAAVFVVLAVVITVIAAAFYNMFAELFGGIELTITEDETTL